MSERLGVTPEQVQVGTSEKWVKIIFLHHYYCYNTCTCALYLNVHVVIIV